MILNLNTDSSTRRITAAKGILALGVVALVAASCGSADQAAPATSPESAPSQSTAVSTTAVPAASSSTTATEDPTADIEASFAEQFQAWRACTADYDACDPTVAFADYYAGRTLTNLTEAVTSKQGRGRKNTPTDPDTDAAVVESIEWDTADPGVASVAYCSIDSRIVTELDTSGAEVVVDDSVFHEQGTASLELGDDDVWRIVEFDVLQSSSEVPICDG